MFSHVGMLTLIDDVTDAQRSALEEGLSGLVGTIDGLRTVQVAFDRGLTEGNAGVVFVLTFDSEEAWRAYSVHEAHKAVIRERIAPVLVSKSFVQVEGPVALDQK